MAFKALKVKKGFFEVHGIEEFIDKKWRELDKKVDELRKSLGIVAKKPKSAQRAKSAKRSAPKSTKPVSVNDRLVAALEASSRRAELLKAGKQKDQLLRALIPLYVGRSINAEISSGATSKFWSRYGVKFAAPNAAKALREHVGYARRTRNGPQITPNGVKYVEESMNGLSSRKRKAA